MNPGTASGTFDSATGAVTLNDTFKLTFVGTGTASITCVTAPIHVALSGIWDPATQDVTLATTSSFTIPQFLANSGPSCALAVPSLNKSPGGVTGAVGNAMSLALHGQFAPGLPTTTTLVASPDSPQLAGTSVTLTATVTDPSGKGAPTGSVTFNDNGAPLGTGTLDGSDTATLTTSTILPGPNQQLTATYSGDQNYSSSTSTPTSYTIQPVPTVSANLPSTLTVPTVTTSPTINALSTDYGPPTGGTQVTITGTGFAQGSIIDFGSTPATDVTITNSGSITATSPAGTGTVDVTVTTPAGGTSATSSADLFAYSGPTVTSIAPNAGPATGGSSITTTITGTDFLPDATVSFGSDSPGRVTFVSPSQLTVLAPRPSSGVPGTVDVTVSTGAGTSPTSAADEFTYTNAPIVGGLQTPAGPATGGTSVAINGYQFVGATAVKFGSAPATSFTVNSAGNTITAKSPPGTSGTTVDVTVIAPGGTSATSSADQFTYGPPTVTGISPNSGPSAGGTQVTITGTGFAPSAALASDGPSVKFGSTNITAANVTVNSPTSLTVTSPPGTGTVDVTVTTKSGGTSVTSPADQFTYSPTVTGISPASGPAGGGTSVAITGTGFTGATAVDFGSKAATSFTVNSAASITAVSPSGSGTEDVTVTTPAGTSPTGAADQFSYGAPTITSVSPNAGTTAGGTTVVITGTRLSGATVVMFGTTAATSFTVNSDTQLTAIAPAGSAGMISVSVTAPAGTGTDNNAFTYNTAPSVSAITPTSGTYAGGTGVTVTGTGFTAASGVYFGSTPAAFFRVVDDTTLTATAPGGTGGQSVDVTVTSATGTSAAWSGDVFTYTGSAPTPTPTVTGVAPSTGSVIGGTKVSVTGTNFVSGATTVNFGSTAATSVTVTSPTSLTAISPAEGTGTVDVTVKTAGGGTSTTSLADQFTYSPGGDPGLAAFTITNPVSGQPWDSLYMKIVLSGIGGQPNANVTLSYQDSSGSWCPISLTGSGNTITAYFSGASDSCGSPPNSFSLGAGASLNVPFRLSYASDTYLGTQAVTATLYSGTCTSATSCTQAGALTGTSAGSGQVQLVPTGNLVSTTADQCVGATACTPATSPVPQGYLVTLRSKVTGMTSAGGQGSPTGTVEYLLDGAPANLMTYAGNAPATNPVAIASGVTSFTYIDTSDLSVGTHTLVSEYSGDSTFAPSSLTETITVLPPPTGIPLACTFYSGQGSGTRTAYATITSATPSPTLSGTNAWVSGMDVSLDVDSSLVMSSTQTIQLLTGTPSPFTLSPGGSASGTATTANSGTTTALTWSNMSASVPVTGDPGSAEAVGIDSFGLSENLAGSTVGMTCTAGAQPAQVVAIPIAGNTLTASPDGGSLPGAPVILTDTVYPQPTNNPGMVEFFDGSTDLGWAPVDPTSSTASFTTSSLAFGDHQLTAVWSGNANIPQNTSNEVNYAIGTGTTTALTSSSNPANAAKAVTFTATVTPPDGASTQPTGDVSFAVDGTAPAACQNVALSTTSPPTATCKLSFKAGTTHSVVATYSGDATYLSSASDPLSQNMLPGTTSTLTTPKNPAPAGNVTFWDGVAATGGGAVPTGTVAFTVDNKASTACAHQPLGPGGGASCTLSFKAGTTHTVSATYAGLSSYSGSKSNTISLKVSGASSATKPKVTTASATLGSGKSLTAGQSIATGSYKLTMQSDGNLVEYQGSKALWASGTSGHPGAKVTMQKDGNLVEYQGGKAIWASNTSGHAGAHLTLQGSDGNVVIYTTANKAIWATGA